MEGICYIVANAITPAFGWQVRARGVRAEQLAAQASHVFSSVRIILFVERFDQLRGDRGAAILTAPRPDTILMPIDAFAAFCERIEPATFVFTQTDFSDRAALASERHTIVYDILSVSEMSRREASARPSELELLRQRHQEMIELSSVVVVNGEKVAARLADDLDGRRSCVVPLAPPRTEDGPPERRRTHLAFGGPVRRWTDVTPAFRIMAAFLRERTDVPAIMIAPPAVDDDTNALEYSALELMAHVTSMWNLSTLNDAQIMAMAFGVVDWAPLDEERAHESSLRALLAVAAGVPVLHQSGTALDSLWDSFPGEALQGPLTVSAVADFVERARAGVYDAAVATAREVLQRVRRDERPFLDLAA